MDNISKRFFWTVTIFLLFSSLFTALGQTAIPTHLTFPKVVFTDPDVLSKHKKDFSVFQVIEQVIDAVPAGEQIHVSVFKLNEPKIISALTRAKQRGVEVKIIIDIGSTSEDINDPTIQKLSNRLNAFYAFDNDLSKKAIIHNKFLICSKMITTKGFASHVVLQTSSNFQKKDAEKLQDMLIVQNQKIYNGYLDYWKKIEELGKNNNWGSYEYTFVTDIDSGISVKFLPKQKEDQSGKKDVVEEELEKITSPEGTKIYASISKWDSGRENVIKELGKLEKNGARVELIISKTIEKEVKEKIKEKLKHVTVLDKGEARMHTRYILIDGFYNGKQTQVIITGSPNLTKRSLRHNFEALLVVKDHPALFQQYLLHFRASKAMD